MIGLVVQYGGHIVIVTAVDRDQAEGIALDMFESVGLDLDNLDVNMFEFDPTSASGIILSEESTEMAGWSKDGWRGV